jgi:hypothetical protein
MEGAFQKEHSPMEEVWLRNSGTLGRTRLAWVLA